MTRDSQLNPSEFTVTCSSYLRPSYWVAFASLVLWMLIASTVAGQQAGSGESASAERETLSEQIIIDLDRIEVKQVMPVRNQTEAVAVRVRLLLAEEADSQVAASLEHWRHRLRDQVIIAIRSCETEDFLEPDLHRLRRQIMYRMKRTLQAPLVEEILLADYSFAIN